eukprot:CAMPEP_0114521122 /NCGR_PEP_ID=MMETSP0109-20121206/20006_1 /TAXON_ID=29199 /ORGANISM="Chlorarachnion reptans, Strain CCCM449" /LENGTH=568 /DNA_ID=CAMNT_0001702183 /DNA_START=383 /DNA_END=2089 /DNA_ORIENTATION=+
MKRFILAGGKPQDVINMLSKSYRGQARMVNILADWMKKMSPDESCDVTPLLNECFEKEVKAFFDPRKADDVFEMKNKPAWLERLRNQTQWRPLFTELSRKHKNKSLFLNYICNLDPEDEGRGHDFLNYEDAKSKLTGCLKSLVEAIQSTEDGSESKIDDTTTKLTELATKSMPCYVLVARWILALTSQGGDVGLLMRRALQDVEQRAQVALPKESGLSALNCVLQGRKRHPTLDSALSLMERAGRADTLSVNKLHSVFCVQDPSSLPAVVADYVLLRDPQILEKLLDELITPDRTKTKSHREKCADLIALATTGTTHFQNAVGDVNSSLSDTLRSLNQLQSFMSQGKLQGKDVLQLREPVENIPVVAWAFLQWLKGNVQIEKDITIFRLIAGILNQHPLLHGDVLECLKQIFYSDQGSFSTNDSHHPYEEQIVEIYMMLCISGSFRAAFQSLEQLGTRRVQGGALLRSFLKMLIQYIGPPFSQIFRDSLSSFLNHKVVKEAVLHPNYRSDMTTVREFVQLLIPDEHMASSSKTGRKRGIEEAGDAAEATGPRRVRIRISRKHLDDYKI